MKKISIILILLTFIFSLTACPFMRGELMPVTVVLKNSTNYELERIIFDIPQTAGSYSPVYDLLTSDDDSLKPNEEREFVISMYESDFGNQGSAVIHVKDDETQYSYGIIAVDGKKQNRFNITCDDEMNFTFTANPNEISNNESDNIKNENNGDIGFILLGERYYYDAADSEFVMFNYDGTYIYGDIWGVIEGNYHIEDGLIWVAFGEDSEEPPEYFTIVNKYTLEQMHGSICTTIAGTYIHESGGFRLEISDLDTESLNYRFIVAASQQETASGTASANLEAEVNAIWVYSADGGEYGLEILFYNDGHALTVSADESYKWDEMGITGHYEKFSSCKKGIATNKTQIRHKEMVK